jgi:hypothetical protein
MGGCLLLHLYGAAHRPVDAIEHHQQGIAACIDNPATMLRYRWVDNLPSESTQASKRTNVIQSDQTAVSDHVGIDHGGQLPTA